MFDPKIAIKKPLYDRLTRTAEVVGYSSTEEFVIHVLEIAAGDSAEDSEALVRKRLQGLGYLE